jgi:glycosyltransferase involved in cell wall biosynthesis
VSKPSVAVAIPAYNEADGIRGFLLEADQALSPHVDKLWLIVVDDASTDDTRSVLDAVGSELAGVLDVVTNPSNRGHGPSLVEAYCRALSLEPDFVLQVDGDGQFHGSDLRRVLVLLTDQAHAVSGVRRFRQDPWFRMMMTGLVRRYVGWGFQVRARDPNCPLRGYQAGLLKDLLARLPDECLIPNLYLTIVAARRGEALLEVDVSHRVRRGGSSDGTMFRRGARSPIPWRLVRFSIQALRESWSFRGHMDTPAWARDTECTD